MVKLSELPKGTTVDIEGYGEHILKRHWCLVGSKEDIFLLAKEVEEIDAGDLYVRIISVPWGVVEELLDTVSILRDEVSDAYIHRQDEVDTDQIFTEAVEGYRRRLAAEWLEEQASRQAWIRERVAELRADKETLIAVKGAKSE